MRIRTYSELTSFDTFEERFQYLSLKGSVGLETFGSQRSLNQKFYQSKFWRDLRHHVIVRDQGCDLGVEGYEIHSRLLIHHMNPLSVDDVLHGTIGLHDPEYLITTTHETHNDIHYGKNLPTRQVVVERRVGDTKLW